MAQPPRCRLRVARSRTGTILPLTAITISISLSMMGLVIETGRLVARSREVQTAADSAALVAAEMLNRHSTNTVARTTAVNFVSTHNGVTPGSVLVNMPPTTGPFANQSGFAEAKITYWLETPLGRLLNASHQTPLHARALAGPKPTPWKDVLLALDTLSVPGIAATGTGQLRIEGDCATNSHGGGIDENGGTVSGLPGYGAEVSLAGSLLAHQVRVTGGVNAPGNFSGLAAGDTNPLTCRAGWSPDPLKDLPAPRATYGVSILDRGRIRSTTATTSILAKPGLYSEILVSAGTVTFQPGIYVIRGGSLTLTGGTVSGQGVLFYLTGTDYSAQYGTPDNGDGENTPSGSTTMGGVTISTPVNLTPFNNPTNPLHGLLIYTRRFNTNPIILSSSQQSGQLSGTVYSKWGPLTLAGQGIYNLQLIVRKASWIGSQNLTVSTTGSNLVKSTRVYLLE
ncbi:MAG: pilus assembly protein TadG-related protein [Planctomycetaceae bacterium]